VKTFPTDRIRNVVFVGHGGSGKTTLAEALLFAAGVISRTGRVEDGTTVCDFDPESQRRGISVSLALAPFELDDCKVNVIDTPGYADFVGDVVAALRVADLAIFVVSAVEGVEVQTELAWRLAAAANLPRAIFVNKLDRERASFERTLQELQDAFGAGVAPVELPIGEEREFRGVIDLLEDEAITYDGRSPRGTTGAIPDELVNEEHAVHDALIEGIVVADDDLTQRYLDDEKIAVGDLVTTLARGIAAATVFPVLCGSATRLVGIDRLTRFIVDEGPAPSAGRGPAATFVFKTLVDPYLGHVNLFKSLQGTIAHDDVLVNGRTLADQRMHQLLFVRGGDQEPVPSVAPGDLAAVAKLADTTTGDVLAVRGTDIDVEPFTTPAPVLATAILPKSNADDDRLANALGRLLDEDPALSLERNPETRQMLLWGAGEMHLAIALERLTRQFGVEVETEDVRVPYRETITSSAEAEGRYKKQTGGHGQFGVACLRVEPLERGAGFEWVDAIVGGAIPKNLIPAVEKGVRESMTQGGVFGHPVVDVRVTCFDGKFHSVDSSEMSFKMAGSIACKEAMAKAQPILLEPVSELVVTAPEEHQGDIMGDLNARRGRIQGAGALGDGEAEIVALVPASEILRYAVDLRSMTHGQGRFTVSHARYDPVPSQVAEQLVRATAR